MSSSVEQMSWLTLTGFEEKVVDKPKRVRKKKSPALGEQLPLIPKVEAAPVKAKKPPKEKKKRIVYHGKFEAKKGVPDGCVFSEIQRPGASYVSVEIAHPQSGYRDRIVIKNSGGIKAKIAAAKKQLMMRFRIEKSMGTHKEQKFQRGSSASRTED